MRISLIAILGCVVLAGCHGNPAPAVSNGPAPAPAPAPSEQPAKAPEATTAPPPSQPAAPPPAVPDNLKSAAYDYFGFGNDKPVDYEIVGDASQGIITGSITITLKDVKDGTAYFDYSGSGGLDKLGSNELSLDQTGIHMVKSSVEQVEQNDLQLPNDVSPGHTWTSHEKTTGTALAMDVVTTNTIKGVKSVKTKRGTFPALEIDSEGKGTENGQKIRMESESYYVKGIGLAKQIIEIKTQDGKPMTMTQQLAD